MNGRRPHGDGSIFRYRNGFAAVLDLGWVDGRRRRRWVYGRTETRPQSAAAAPPVSQQQQRESQGSLRTRTVAAGTRQPTNEVVMRRLSPHRAGVETGSSAAGSTGHRPPARPRAAASAVPSRSVSPHARSGRRRQASTSPAGRMVGSRRNPAGRTGHLNTTPTTRPPPDQRVILPPSCAARPPVATAAEPGTPPSRAPRPP